MSPCVQRGSGRSPTLLTLTQGTSGTAPQERTTPLSSLRVSSSLSLRPAPRRRAPASVGTQSRTGPCTAPPSLTGVQQRPNPSCHAPRCPGQVGVSTRTPGYKAVPRGLSRPFHALRWGVRRTPNPAQ
ncbi:hypothetical protein NDU88_006773 [Pleurodeles waltl]|uniref:Uncharacterized protein n=1 Tax=Pleurodeles waltl TaxID=8319 RepID=A0AAV7VNQ3_PLEWA|nr:hypothetical protein NDU88_006773 [Pleurodeles waltl]